MNDAQCITVQHNVGSPLYRGRLQSTFRGTHYIIIFYRLLGPLAPGIVFSTLSGIRKKALRRKEKSQ